ncbi:MAG: hypothetical protein ACR2QL_09660 [Woeseiaceae bacterium]
MSYSKRIHQALSFFGILASVQLMGCAANLSEDEAFEREYQAVERKQLIREFIDGCEAGGNVVVYTGVSTHRLRDPIKRIPNHANRSDYQCTTTSEVERMQAQMGIR